ncbi:MAG TPA: hypothetical protein VIO38_11195, partial [Rariglobus sp.]
HPRFLFSVLAVAACWPASRLHAQAGMEYEGVTIQAPVAAAERALPATLVVDEDRSLGAIDPRLLGIAYSWSTVNTYLYEHNLRAPFIEAFKGLRLPLNRIGGAEGQAFKWKQAVGPRDQRPSQKIEPWFNEPVVQQCGPLEWVKTLTAIDPRAGFVIALNLLTDTPEDHADLVELLTSPVGENPNGGVAWAEVRAQAGLVEPVKVALWELGNENDWAGQKKSIPPEDYVARCQASIQAIRTVDPRARFAAHAAGAPHNTTHPRPFAGTWHVWHRLVLRELGPDIDYLVFHPYYNHGGVAEQESFITEIRADILALTGSDRIKLFFSEHAVWPSELRNREKWPTTHNLHACLLTGQFLLDQLRYPGSMAAVWSMNAGPWGMFYPDGRKGVYTTGIADLLRTLNHGLGDRLLESRLEGERTRPEGHGTTLASAVMRDAAGVNIVLINLEPAAPRKLSVRLKNPWRLVEQMILTGDSPESHNTQDAAGLRTETRRPDDATSFTAFTVPPCSVVVLKLIPLSP